MVSWADWWAYRLEREPSKHIDYRPLLTIGRTVDTLDDPAESLDAAERQRRGAIAASYALEIARDDGDTATAAAARAQLDAFAETTRADQPRARVTDPATSHAAAVRARRGLTVKQLAVLDLLQATAGPASYDELIARYNRNRSRGRPAWYPPQTDSGIRTRAKELRDAGYVCHVDDAGTTEAGGRAARWAPTPDGQMVDVDAAREKIGQLPIGGKRR